MRRFLLTSFAVLALVVGAVGGAPAAHAQTCPAGYDYDANEGCQPISTGAETCKYGYMYDANAGCIPAETIAGTSIDPAAAKAGNDYKPTTADENYGYIMQKIMSLFAWLVGVAAITLDNAAYYTVVTMGTYVNDLSAIGVTWSILRDIGNIFLIFGFLAIGITTILNVDWYGGGKKMLPMMFVAAIFLNFSLFITEAVIDTGNLFATQFYTQINGGDPAGVKSFDPGSISTSNEGISGKIMSQLGLQTIYGDALDPAKAKFLFTGANQWFVGFMGVILFIVTAFVLFSLAFVLIARFVILIFLIILAPVGFAGLAVPQLASIAKKWWDKLFEQTITAPVLLLMLYIALTIITDVRFLTGFGAGSNWTGFVNNSDLAGFASMMLSFLVAMGLLLAVVIFAKNLSAFGASGASKLAGKLSFGATAWGMRTSGGWLAKKGANVARKTWVGRVPLAGTGLVKGLDKIASGSFDMRGVAMGGGLKALGIDAGVAQKGGYKADLKARTESRTKYAGELTGRELNDDEKAKLAIAQNKIKQLEKDKKSANTVQQAKDISEKIKTIEKEEIEKIEAPTEKGAQRKYASVLELGINPKSKWQWLNPAANTDAAKIIRAGAKKAKPDKDWSANMKNLLKEAAGEAGEEEAGATAPATGGAPTPPAGHTISSGGIIIPESPGSGPRH